MTVRSPLPRLTGLLVVSILALLLTAGCIPQTQPEGWSAPAIDGTTVYLATREGRIMRLTESGDSYTEQKIYPPADERVGHVYGNLIIRDGVLYIASYDRILAAVDVQSGAARATTTLLAPVVADPVFYDDRLLIATSASSRGVVQSRSATDLSLGWETSPPLPDGILSAVAVEGNWGFFAGLDRAIHSITLDNGAFRWRFDAEGGFAATPTIANRVLYVGGFDRKFYALGIDDGRPVWTQPFTGAQNWYWSRAIVDGGRVYVGNLDGFIYALDAATGQQVWSYDAGGQVLADMVLTGGRLIAATTNGRLVAVNAADGSQAVEPRVLQGLSFRHDLKFANGQVYAVSIAGGRFTLHRLNPQTLQGPAYQVQAN